jgi:hypothetical protein
MSLREKLVLTIVLILFGIAHVGGVVMMGRALATQQPVAIPFMHGGD